MDLFAASLALLGATSYPVDNVPTQKLWLYSCDVLLPNTCFRLPTGMSVTYQVPTDSGVYQVKRSDGVSMLIYTGSAPDRSRMTGVPSLELDSSTHRLTAFVSGGGETGNLDIFISPKASRSTTTVTHLHSNRTNDSRDLMAQVVSGLRPCVRKSREHLVCPTRSIWGEALSRWVLDVGAKGDGGN